MENTEHLKIALLSKIFGNPKRDRDVIEYEFNCKSKVCRLDKDKYNLSYNSKNNTFHCWKCRYKGVVHKLIIDYGNDYDLKQIKKLVPLKKSIKKEKVDFDISDMITCSLPENFKQLSKPNSSRHYKAAFNYVTKQRGFSLEDIKKYNIGYTEDKGNRKYRIIIPSYNQYGQMNYYVGRSYYEKVKPNYMAPSKEEVARTEIIFNLKNINFDLPVFLVEGAFDMMRLYNALPMLGKEPADVILNKFIEYKSKIILCLDEDALCDSVMVYNKLTNLGLEVYYIEVKGDIDEFYKLNGKLKTIKLFDFCKNKEFQELFKTFAKEHEYIKNEEVIDEIMILNKWLKFKDENLIKTII